MIRTFLLALALSVVDSSGQAALHPHEHPDAGGSVGPRTTACKKYDVQACTQCPGDVDRECKSGRDVSTCTQTGPTTCANGGQCDQYLGQGNC